jgi:hypothetical protein
MTERMFRPPIISTKEEIDAIMMLTKQQFIESKPSQSDEPIKRLPNFNTSEYNKFIDRMAYSYYNQRPENRLCFNYWGLHGQRKMFNCQFGLKCEYIHSINSFVKDIRCYLKSRVKYEQDKSQSQTEVENTEYRVVIDVIDCLTKSMMNNCISVCVNHLYAYYCNLGDGCTDSKCNKVHVNTRNMEIYEYDSNKAPHVVLAQQRKRLRVALHDLDNVFEENKKLKTLLDDETNQKIVLSNKLSEIKKLIH